MTSTAQMLGSISTLWKKSRCTASQTIQTQVMQQQAGFDEGGEVFDLAVAVLMIGIGRLVADAHEYRVTTEATRSSEECSASERMPRLPLRMPTTNLKCRNDDGNQNAVARDTRRFSTRISSGLIVVLTIPMSLPWAEQ